MSAHGNAGALTELGVDIALRELWEVLEPIIAEAELEPSPLGVPQLACAIRAAYGRGFADALRWIEGTPLLVPDREAPPSR